jgi:3-carboxy-cis,cis-muconate cycloisomerase
MLGRTLLQPAVPITFGLKVAGWFAAIERSWARLDQSWSDALVVQYGGAAGTRAAAAPHGSAIAAGLAARLGLAPAGPWHSDRDRLGALITSLGLHAAALGKAARDIVLLMQAEVGEVAEPGGGSSTMPHKRNPSGCAVVLAAAARLPGLVSAFLSGAVQEHERAVGGVQAEWPTVAAAVQAVGAAVDALAAVIDGLTVHPERMRENIVATRGAVFAEAAVLQLAPALGRERARELVEAALRRCRDEDRSLAELLQSLPDVIEAMPAHALADLERPERYLGDAEALRRALLEPAAPPAKQQPR